ncbi:hypothetical protein L1987_52092 [Smallanthus sonchifolius]|uniref:Uncharacterized protein n=1 Tax=Smallanthus sonchifolius TaxID=185202 RepID=A0ACB9ESH2_9ASTR|nr:hypothetical protein L1987_52092 [Smallanthus sonchifolius]
MMMMMIMIAGLVDSITTPIKAWLDDHLTATNITVKEEVGVDSCRVDCIVCLSEVRVGERFAMLERCRHGFHVECVEIWLKHHPNCPLCRTPTDEGTHNMWSVYLKKPYEIMSRYVLETMASWLTTSFTQGLQSGLSESCSYL